MARHGTSLRWHRIKHHGIACRGHEPIYTLVSFGTHMALVRRVSDGTLDACGHAIEGATMGKAPKDEG